MWHQTDEFAKLENTSCQLEDPHQHDCREQILHTVLGDERDHDHCERAGCARNHSRPTANRGGDQANDEGRVETNERINTGDEGKGHGLRHQREGHRQASQKLDLDPVRRKFSEIFLRKILRAEAICESSEWRFACHGMAQSVGI